MRLKKRTLVLFLTIAFVLTLVGCRSAATDKQQEQAESTVVEPDNEMETSESVIVSEPSGNAVQDNTKKESEDAGSDTLVIFFSRTGEQYNVGVIDKGNTAIVAEMIAEKTGADLFEVLPAADHYPTTYSELTDVAKKEQNDKARPEYSGDIPDLSQYDTIFIGAPVWWGDWPMIMYTVFENSDFSGKKLVPFSTHEGSGLSGFDQKLSSACPDSEVLKGLATQGRDCQESQDSVSQSVDEWLSDLGY